METGTIKSNALDPESENLPSPPQSNASAVQSELPLEPSFKVLTIESEMKPPTGKLHVTESVLELPCPCLSPGERQTLSVPLTIFSNVRVAVRRNETRFHSPRSQVLRFYHVAWERGYSSITSKLILHSQQ